MNLDSAGSVISVPAACIIKSVTKEDSESPKDSFLDSKISKNDEVYSYDAGFIIDHQSIINISGSKRREKAENSELRALIPLQAPF